jgi:hypothetical protein
MTGSVALDTRIARPPQQRWQPANFQLRAPFQENVRPVQDADEARSRVHEMRVLRPFGQARHLDFVAADSLGNSAEVRERGDHIKRSLRRD